MQRVYTLCEIPPMGDMGDRLRQARERLFRSARQAAIRHHWPPSTYSAHENGQNDYGPDDAQKYAKAFKTKASWLLTGEGEPGWPKARIDDPDYVPPPAAGILEIDVRAGMGGGGTAADRGVLHNGEYSDPVKEEAWHFPARFMREEVRAPESRVIVLETQGDSMAPTLLSGDRVVVDTGHTVPSPDGIYAVRDQYGYIVVKRLQTMRGGRIRVISDNKAHDPEDVGHEDIAIVGRVLWGLKRL